MPTTFSLGIVSLKVIAVVSFFSGGLSVLVGSFVGFHAIYMGIGEILFGVLCLFVGDQIPQQRNRATMFAGAGLMLIAAAILGLMAWIAVQADGNWGAVTFFGPLASRRNQ